MSDTKILFDGIIPNDPASFIDGWMQDGAHYYPMLINSKTQMRAALSIMQITSALPKEGALAGCA